MSLKTRCPACDTVFKIVPDQLKVSKGWVRCGRCAEVFDAAAHAAAPDDSNPWPQSSPSKTFVQSNAVIAKKNSEITPKNIATKPINTPAIDNLLPTKDKLETDLSFVRVAKNKAFWQQSKVITSLRAACVALASLLFVQVVFSQRNHLVAAHPPLASSFESVCQAIGCKIEPFRNIDAFKIDSSSFQKAPAVAADPAQADVFALKITLKNNSDLPLAMPAVELTLTEAGDKPVIRRVLSAKDLGFNGTTFAANADWTGEMTLVVTPSPATAPVSGYRVLLFYP
jgi:predicted Zn finger-like uncharacterized protein